MGRDLDPVASKDQVLAEVVIGLAIQRHGGAALPVDRVLNNGSVNDHLDNLKTVIGDRHVTLVRQQRNGMRYRLAIAHNHRQVSRIAGHPQTLSVPDVHGESHRTGRMRCYALAFRAGVA